MSELKISNKDEIVMKILHYFVTEENYRPIILRGVQNEIWLENLEKPYKIIRININYLHNDYQYQNDIAKCKVIMKKIKKKTLSLKMNMLNILVDTGEDVQLNPHENIKSKIVKKISDLKKDKEIVEDYPSVVTKINNKKTDAEEFVQLSEDMNKKNIEEEKKVSRFYKNNTPIVTNALIIINLIVFVLMYVFGRGSNDTGTLLTFGANYWPLVEAGEWWRLITSAFVHIGIMHLLFNMYALYIVGAEIERYYGKVKFLIVYILSAVFGSMFSCLFSNSISAGASGAIFGLFGSLLYFGYHYRSTLSGFLRGQIIPLIVANLLLGVMIPGIDMAAHIGGLIGGILLSMAVGLEDRSKKSEKVNGIIMSIILFGFLAYLLLFMK